MYGTHFSVLKEVNTNEYVIRVYSDRKVSVYKARAPEQEDKNYYVLSQGRVLFDKLDYMTGNLSEQELNLLQKILDEN
jgi:hypothetical protein